MTAYTATIELDLKNPEADHFENALDTLEHYHAAPGISPRGWAEIRLTVLAENLTQATITAITLVETAMGRPAIAAHVLTEAEADAREGWAPTTEMLSVPQAAELLGISRQAVLLRITNNTLPAEKVGRSWAVPRLALTRLLEQRQD